MRSENQPHPLRESPGARAIPPQTSGRAGWAPWVLGAALALAHAGPAHATAHLQVSMLSDLSLEQLLNVPVVSTSRYVQRSSDAPAAPAVITADDIRTFGYRTLGEALNGMRGLFLNNDRSYNYLGVRGFLRPNDFNSRVLLMVDGRRLNDTIYDSAGWGEEFMLDLHLVDRIEYIPGPGSSLYGANAVLGVVHIITKATADLQGLRVGGEAGSQGTYKARATLGHKLDNGAEVLLSASRLRSAGAASLYFPEFDTPASNRGLAQGIDHEYASHAYARLQFDRTTLTTGYYSRNKQVPTAGYDARFNDPGASVNDSAYFAELRHQASGGRRTQVEWRLFHQGYDYRSPTPYDASASGGPARVMNEDSVSARWWGGEVKWVSTAWERHTLVAGAEFQMDQRQHLLNYDVDPYSLQQDSRRSGRRIGLFAQDEWRVRPDLLLTSGLRADRHHMLDRTQVNPRLGLVWAANEHTTAKLLYGAAFRAPNVYERDLNAFGNVANTHLREERIRTLEAVLEWRPVQAARLTASLFRNDYLQMLETPVMVAAGGSNAFTNSGEYRGLGFDLSGEYRWRNSRLLRASLSHVNLRNRRLDTWADGSPRQVLKLSYAEPLANDHAMLGTELIGISRRMAPQGGVAPGFVLVNLVLSSRQPVAGWNLSAGVYNLLGSAATQVGGSPPRLVQDTLRGDGRSVRLTAERRL